MNNASYYGGDIPFLSISDMGGRYISETAKTITQKGLNNSAAWIIPAGSVSLAMYASVGKVTITSCDMATSQAFFNMVFDSEIMRDFVYTRLNKAELNDEWSRLVSTGTQSNLNATKVREWRIEVPTEGEQRTIGSFFSSVDELITLHQRKQHPCSPTSKDGDAACGHRAKNTLNLKISLTLCQLSVCGFASVIASAC